MKYILIMGMLFLTACSSAPNRCNQKNADASYHELGSLDLVIIRS
jgi:starvation-inducible outer membrane lipoprotein